MMKLYLQGKVYLYQQLQVLEVVTTWTLQFQKPFKLLLNLCHTISTLNMLELFGMALSQGVIRVE